MATRFRRIMPGLLTATDAAAINHIAEAVENLATRELTATFGTVASVPGHLSPGSAIPSHPDVGLGFWARVTGTDVDGRHAWQEVWPDIGVDGILVWRDGSRSSDFAQTPAYKADGGTAAVGTRVWLQFAPGRHRFIYGTTGSDSPLTVAALDGDPSFPGIHTLLFDEADGFIVDSPSPGVVRIDIGQASEFRLPTVPPTGPSLTTPGFMWLDPTSGLVTFIRPDGEEAELVNMPLPEVDGGPGPYKVWWTAPPDGTAEWKDEPVILALGLRGSNGQEIYQRAKAPETGGYKLNWPDDPPGDTAVYLKAQLTLDEDGYFPLTWVAIPLPEPEDTVTGGPKWIAIDLTFADFADSVLSEMDLAIFPLGGHYVVHDVYFKHTAAFTGGTTSAAGLSIGHQVVGSPIINQGYFVSQFDVRQAPGDTVYAKWAGISADSVKSDKITFAPAYVIATLNVSGGATNQLTQGAVRVYLLVSDLASAEIVPWGV